MPIVRVGQSLVLLFRPSLVPTRVRGQLKLARSIYELFLAKFVISKRADYSLPVAGCSQSLRVNPNVT